MTDKIFSLHFDTLLLHILTTKHFKVKKYYEFMNILWKPELNLFVKK